MKLNDHILQLPTHSLETDLWSQVEKQLCVDDSIGSHLPRHKANSDLWLSIENQLNAKKRRHVMMLQSWAVAASVLVVFTLGFIFHAQQEQTHIYYTEEMVIEPSLTPEWILPEVNVMENCSDQPAICSTPDFTRLKSSLDHLKLEEQKLRQIQQITIDPNIEVYHSRLVKDIQQVEAQILQLFS